MSPTPEFARAGWFKSSHSNAGTGCVEVAALDHEQIGVRDSKDPAGPALVFAPAEWTAFVADVREGALSRR